MRTKLLSTIAISALVTITSISAADAAGPRVTEVNTRISDQQARINAGVTNGTINAKQEVRDENALTKVETQESKDEAKNDGSLTQAELNKLNAELNGDSVRIYDQKHN